jgi:hypothetical protein
MITLATITQSEAILILFSEGYTKLIANYPLDLDGQEIFTGSLRIFAAACK